MRMFFASLLAMCALQVQGEQKPDSAILELRVLSCTRATNTSIQSASESLSTRSVAEVEQYLQEYPGIIIRGKVLRSLPLIFHPTTSTSDVENKSQQIWRDIDTTDDTTLYFHSPNPNDCEFFPAESIRLLTQALIKKECDNNAPRQYGRCALDYGVSASYVAAENFKLLPRDYFEKLEHRAEGIFMASPSKSDVRTIAQSSIARHFLIDRVALLSPVDWQISPYAYLDNYSYITIMFRPKIIPYAQQYPILCSQKQCFASLGGTANHGGKLISAIYIVSNGDASLIQSHLKKYGI